MTTQSQLKTPTKYTFGYYLGTAVLKLSGWKISGNIADIAKFIAVVAPHTSNWDFVIAISVKLHLGLQIRFFAKHTLFSGPLGILLKRWGGMPVNRTSAHGLVAQVADQFAQHPQLILGIAPEGTRKKTAQWKSGFLHIAAAANVPVIPMALDYRSKTFIIMAPEHIRPSIDTEGVAAELERIKALYTKDMGKYPDNVSGL